MRPILATIAVLTLSCVDPHAARPPRAGGQAGEGGEAGSAAGGSGGAAGGAGDGGQCRVADLPVAVLERVGAATDPGNFPGVVTMNRPAERRELPPGAADADRVLEITEVRDADARFRVWYRVGHEAAVAPVGIGDPVALTFEEWRPWGRSAAVVLRDPQGAPIWVLLTGGFGDLPSAAAVVKVEPVGPPLCEQSCGFFRHEADVTVGEATARVAPGATAELGGGTFWLAELATEDRLECTDLPGEIAGWAWSRTHLCGGFRGNVCPDGSFCSYPPGDCGAADGTGICQPRPAACPEVEDPVCGCDGQRYGNACAANASGTSVGTFCDGLFLCGDSFCNPGRQYCRRSVSDVGGVPDDYACLPLPACNQGSGCACLSSEPCGSWCSGDPARGLTLTCPGG